MVSPEHHPPKTCHYYRSDCVLHLVPMPCYTVDPDKCNSLTSTSAYFAQSGVYLEFSYATCNTQVESKAEIRWKGGKAAPTDLRAFGCPKGYEPDIGLLCKPCKMDMFKATRGDFGCQLCPLHLGMAQRNEGSDSCACAAGFVRTPQRLTTGSEPALRCDQVVGPPCSGHGTCVNSSRVNASCVCEEGYTHSDCSARACTICP